MRLRYSKKERKDRRPVRRSFFSRAKHRLLTAALATGMALVSAGTVRASMNVPINPPPPPLPAYEKRALVWMINHKSSFNFSLSDRRKTAVVAAFITKHMRSGVWYSSRRVPPWPWPVPVHPRCTSTLQNGDCWAIGFRESWHVTTKYCNSSQGAGDSRCANGKPRQEPPLSCYGYTDFKKYVKDCELQFLPRRP